VASPLVQQVSTDDLPAFAPRNSDFVQHATEVETDTFSWGSTVVSAFQVGRDNPAYGGAQAIGWASSLDDGKTWQHGILPGLTMSSPSPNSSYPLVVNQSVGYDAKHQVWIIPSVTYVASGATFREKALLVNTSADGVHWVTATTAVPNNVDKAWITCDDTASSPHYGNCYVAYSKINSSDALAVVTSTDGGTSWTSPVAVPSATAGVDTTGYNTNPVVRPDGTVVLVATDVTNGANGSVLFSSTSNDGGATWSVPTDIATIEYHSPPGGIRALNKPTVDVDAAGTVYVAWSDCRFHSSCDTDDIVYATSAGGAWSAPSRIAIQPLTSTTDQFIPGFAVAPGTAGSTAELSVVYYTYEQGGCATDTCRLDARYATSYDGGAHWSWPYTINSTPMPLSWLAQSSRGPMVGDYESISYCHGAAITVAALATAAPDPDFHEAEWALTLPVGWGRPAAPTELIVGGKQRIGYGAAAALAATLVSRPSGQPIAGASVTLKARRGNTGAFHTVRTLTTSGSGTVGTSVAPRHNAEYQWSFDGSAGHLATTSRVVAVLVASAVRAHVTSHHVAPRKVVKVYGTVAPRAAGRVTLQRRHRGQWQSLRVHATLRHRRLPDGTHKVGYVLKYSAVHAGRVTVRVSRAATGTNVAGHSKPIKISVV
jgi:hypothetical protein